MPIKKRAKTTRKAGEKDQGVVKAVRAKRGGAIRAVDKPLGAGKRKVISKMASTAPQTLTPKSAATERADSAAARAPPSKPWSSARWMT